MVLEEFEKLPEESEHEARTSGRTNSTRFFIAADYIENREKARETRFRTIDWALGMRIIGQLSGEMAEWSIATVLKTVVSKDTQGSNPCLSASRS